MIGKTLVLFAAGLFVFAVTGSPQGAGKGDPAGDSLPAGAVARLGSTRFTHPHVITFAAFSPDGKSLAVASQGPSRHLQIWDLATGRPLPRFAGPNAPVISLAFAPDGKALAVASPNGVSWLDTATGAVLRQFPDPPLNSAPVAVSHDGKIVAAGGATNVQNGNPNHILLWDAVTGAKRLTLVAHRTPVHQLAFSRDGKRLTSVTLTYTNVAMKQVVRSLVEVWDTASGKKVHQLTRTSSYPVFSPGGATLATAEPGRTVLTEVASGRIISELLGEYHSFRFSPDGKTLATGRRDELVRLWDVATGKEVRRLDGLPGGVGWVLAFSSDGKLLAASNSDWQSSALRIWDVETGQERRPFAGHVGVVSRVVFSPDGKTVASGSSDHTVRLWDPKSGAERRVLPRHHGPVDAVAFDPQGKRLATTDGKWVRLWDPATGNELGNAVAPKMRVLTMAFTDGGKSLNLALADGGKSSWRLTDNTWEQTSGGPQPSLAFGTHSADGRLLVTGAGLFGFGAGGGVRVVRLADGKIIREISGRPGNEFNATVYWHAVLSPDGGLLATSENLQTQGLRLILTAPTIRLWDLATGQEILKMDGQKSTAQVLAFSPDGRILASGHGPGGGWQGPRELIVTLWDSLTGEKLGELQGHRGNIASLAFSPDGKWLVSGSEDRTALVWDVGRLAPRRNPAAANATPERVRALWNDLGDDDVARAFRAVAAMADVPKLALPLLKNELRPVPQVERKQFDRLVAGLDSGSFAKRQQATEELQKMGDVIVPLLRQSLKGDVSLESRRRMEVLLEKADWKKPSAEQVRPVRALIVLERDGSAESRKLLEVIAGGAPEARLTQQARAALDRLRLR
jgi:WD40 repeat protein